MSFVWIELREMRV